jgi:hypothetical protein
VTYDESATLDGSATWDESVNTLDESLGWKYENSGMPDLTGKTLWQSCMTIYHDDQIVQIFAYWAIIFFGKFFLIAEVTSILGLLFSMEKVLCQFWQKMRWATFWGDFFTTASGHPALIT